MPARAMWKAELHVEDQRVPVKLYAAVQETAVHFRLLHEADHRPVQQQMIDPARGEPVPRDAVTRAVQVDRGVFVALTDDERAALEPTASRAIAVSRVVPAGKVEMRWFDRPYYLGPDGDEAAYFALAEALDARNAVGIAHWVLRRKRYTGALLARGGYLMLETLRHAEDLLPIDAIQPPASRAPDPREIALAQQLIGTLEDDFDPASYRDEHREQVLALVQAKAAGKVLHFPKTAARRTTRSLIGDLEASLAAGRAAGGRRGR